MSTNIGSLLFNFHHFLALKSADCTLQLQQAEGKKRMKALGKVEVPQEAFMAVLNLVRPVAARCFCCSCNSLLRIKPYTTLCKYWLLGFCAANFLIVLELLNGTACANNTFTPLLCINCACRTMTNWL